MPNKSDNRYFIAPQSEMVMPDIYVFPIEKTPFFIFLT